jgi:hypothetical protein
LFEAFAADTASSCRSRLIGIRIGSPDNTCDHVCEEPVNTSASRQRVAPSESRSIPLAVISVRRCAELGLAVIIRIGYTVVPFDHLVGTSEDRRRDLHADLSRHLEVEDKFKLGGL